MRWRCQYAVGGGPSFALPLRRPNFFDKASSFLGGGGNMVTHSELILIGQLIVSILTLFVHIYDNKKK